MYRDKQTDDERPSLRCSKCLARWVSVGLLRFVGAAALVAGVGGIAIATRDRVNQSQRRFEAAKAGPCVDTFYNIHYDTDEIQCPNVAHRMKTDGRTVECRCVNADDTVRKLRGEVGAP
jgi:hypothetical protein